jgi:hypothetical protein
MQASKRQSNFIYVSTNDAVGNSDNIASAIDTMSNEE